MTPLSRFAPALSFATQKGNISLAAGRRDRPRPLLAATGVGARRLHGQSQK